jgi:hypothetical protein
MAEDQPAPLTSQAVGPPPEAVVRTTFYPPGEFGRPARDDATS